MDISDQPVDLLKTYQRFVRRHGARRQSLSFGIPIVAMADAVIGGTFFWSDVPGVRKCLMYLIRTVRWRHTLLMIPVGRARPFYQLPYAEGRAIASRLADSLLLTVVAYRVQLDEKHSGLSAITFGEITQGLELILDWVERDLPLDRQRNEFIEIIDVQHVTAFILGEPNAARSE